MMWPGSLEAGFVAGTGPGEGVGSAATTGTFGTDWRGSSGELAGKYAPMRWEMKQGWMMDELLLLQTPPVMVMVMVRMRRLLVLLILLINRILTVGPWMVLMLLMLLLLLFGW